MNGPIRALKIYRKYYEKHKTAQKLGRKNENSKFNEKSS